MPWTGGTQAAGARRFDPAVIDARAFSVLAVSFSRMYEPVRKSLHPTAALSVTHEVGAQLGRP